MITVTVVNDYLKSGLGKDIFHIISTQADCIYINPTEYMKKGENPEFLIYESRNIKKIDSDKNIVVMGQNFKKTDKSVFWSSDTIIVDSSNKLALKTLENISTQIIVCGMSLRDTVSLSGIVGDSTAVCLKRNAKTLGGKILSECERILPNMNLPDYAVMCAGTILLLK